MSPNIKEYNNFEAGEGKSQLNSHFAHISHTIVRWVRLGNDLESGEQVAELIKVTVSLLTIRRKQVRKIRIAEIITEKSMKFLIYRLSYSHVIHSTV